MLKRLYIKNYALIDSIDIEFERGLNILTGETGAGKSILIGAIGLILGERASAETVRQGAPKAVVEAAFATERTDTILALLDENQIDWMDPLMVRREVAASGQSRCFINDTPANVKTLKAVGELLVDLHGQHEHQSLLRIATHAGLLDDFGGLSGIVSDYTGDYRRLASLFGELENLRGREHSLRERRELLGFQIREIDAVDPQPGEEESLETDLKILENAEALHEQSQRLYELLYEKEQSVYENLVITRNRLDALADIDPSFEELKKECTSAEAIVHEISKSLQRYTSGIEFDPQRLESLRERLGQLSLLKKKYGGSIEHIISHRREIGNEFDLAENFQSSIETLEQNIETVRSRLSATAERLSTKRRDIARKISRLIVKELAALGIPNAAFDVQIRAEPDTGNELNQANAFVRLGKEYYRAYPNGIDRIEFHISTNAGESPKPLAKVASGGEISRIMLAMKSVLAKSERLPLLIFDEIDVGVSGRIAQAVGRSLKNLSTYHQVIAITHLPQIAGLADCHYAVEKTEDGGRTATKVRKLDTDERVREVARLLSGAEITEAGLTGAKELMKMD
jgi:DNA repair protein RecN (Recombination protein N)